MNIPERTRYIGDEDSLAIWWELNGELIDFSSGYTFVGTLASVRTPGTAIFTKTTGFVGAAGSGSEGDGVPNLVVEFPTTGELNDVPSAGRYLFEIVATSAGGGDSTMQMTFNMRARLGS